MKHWIVRYQSVGCLPDSSAVFGDRDNALDYAFEVYIDPYLGTDREYRRWCKRINALKREDGDVLIDNLPGEGENSLYYLVVEECDCPEPWIHEEMGNPNDWPEEEEVYEE